MSLVVRAAAAAVVVWAQRKFSDEEVAASQSFYLGNWRDHLNKDDLKYVAASYMPDAVLKLEVSPGVQGFSASLSEHRRGKEAIGAFWSEATKVVRGHELVLCEASGPFACSTMILDDDRVIVNGPLEFKGLVRGRALSQEWVRVGEDVWKIQHDFIAFEEPVGGRAFLPPASVAPPAPSAAALEQRIEEVVEQRVEEKEAAQETLQALEKQEIDRGVELAKEAGGSATGGGVLPDVPGDAGVSAGVGSEEEGHSNLFYGVCAGAGAGAIYFLSTHYWKRQSISDISAKSMLG